MVDDALEYALNIFLLVIQILDCPAIASGTVIDRIVEKGIGTVEVAKHLEHLIDHLTNSRSGSVDLIDHNQGLYILLECLSEDKFSLSHRPLGGTDHQAHPIDHVHNSLDLTSEILMARRVHNVYAVVVVANVSALGTG